MLHKILLGLLCLFGVVLFAIGALGLALGIGPGFLSFAMVTMGGFAMVVFSGLLGDWSCFLFLTVLTTLLAILRDTKRTGARKANAT
jgi:hypothetical protein